jgi:hypothetical protein
VEVVVHGGGGESRHRITRKHTEGGPGAAYGGFADGILCVSVWLCDAILSAFICVNPRLTPS